MAITRSNLLTNKDNVDRTTYTTASVAPTGNKLEVLFVASTKSGTPDIPSSVTGNGITWFLVRTIGASGVRVSVFVGTAASPSSGTISIAFPATQTSAYWVLEEVSGTVISSGGLDGVASWIASTGSGATSLSLPVMTGNESNAGGLSAFLHDASEVTSPASSWTETSDQTNTLPNSSFETQFLATLATNNTPSASWTTASAVAGVAIEVRDAATAVRAIEPYVLTTNDDNTDATSYTTASITPTARRLILVAVTNTKATTADVPTLSGNGITWSEVAHIQRTATPTTTTIFVGTATSPSAGAITIDFAGATQTGCFWSVIELRGAETNGGGNSAGNVPQSKTLQEAAQATHTITFDQSPFAHPKNATLMATGHGTGTVRYLADSDCIELSTESHTGPTSRMTVYFCAGNDATIAETTSAGNEAVAAVGVELRAAITQQVLTAVGT